MRYLWVFVLLISGAVWAGGYDKDQIDVKTKAQSEATAASEAAATATATAEGGQGGIGGTGGDASATNEGIDIDASDQSRVENKSSNIVLVPNNNTESCLRIWGLSWGNSSGAGGLGYPHRSAACDFEQAGDDAAAIGDHQMAWYWRCHKRNIWKTFKGKGGNKDQAIQACHAKMVTFIDAGTMADRIRELEADRQMLLREREFDRERCEQQVGIVREATRRCEQHLTEDK